VFGQMFLDLRTVCLGVLRIRRGILCHDMSDP
jgi:hypothetical protein